MRKWAYISFQYTLHSTRFISQCVPNGTMGLIVPAFFFYKSLERKLVRVSENDVTMSDKRRRCIILWPIFFVNMAKSFFSLKKSFKLWWDIYYLFILTCMAVAYGYACTGKVARSAVALYVLRCTAFECFWNVFRGIKFFQNVQLLMTHEWHMNLLLELDTCLTSLYESAEWWTA